MLLKDQVRLGKYDIHLCSSEVYLFKIIETLSYILREFIVDNYLEGELLFTKCQDDNLQLRILFFHSKIHVHLPLN